MFCFEHFMYDDGPATTTTTTTATTATATATTTNDYASRAHNRMKLFIIEKIQTCLKNRHK
jgi:hypothetical protein